MVYSQGNDGRKENGRAGVCVCEECFGVCEYAWLKYCKGVGGGSWSEMKKK